MSSKTQQHQTPQPAGTVPGLDSLVNVRQVAAMLGCTERTIRTWRDLGQLPQAITLPGRPICWRRDVIEAWVRARLDAAAQAPAG